LSIGLGAKKLILANILRKNGNFVDMARRKQYNVFEKTFLR